MDNPIINTIGLCSGIGMLEEAVRLGCEYFGWRAKPAALCEWEAYATAVLLERMESKALEPCPIWGGDLRDFDGKPFRGLVDILCAGLPCQPYSVAGKQKGNEDERSHDEEGDGPIPHFLRIVAECRPAVVFCENVPPWVSGGWFRPVGEELSRLGYTVESPLFVTAESVDASHRRERVFVLAHHKSARGFLQHGSDGRQDDTGEEEIRRGRVRGQQRPAVNEQPELCGGEMAYAGHGFDWLKGRGESGRRGEPGGECGNVADALRSGGQQPRAGRKRVFDGLQAMEHAASPRPNGSGQRRIEGKAAYGGEQAGMSGFDIGRNDLGDTSGSRTGEHSPRSRSRNSTGESSGLLGDSSEPRLSQPECDELSGAERFDEGRAISQSNRAPLFAPGPAADWGQIPQMLYPATEPGFRVLVDGLALVVDESRADQLRCGGNGVVATAAAVAFVELMRGAMK